ncbi:MAG: hypothetical protein LBF17_02155 [Mediterranea sp.]|jgi:transcription elongation factor Elf1|nr:hypothetical protein [Mediterranea sp.]
MGLFSKFKKKSKAEEPNWSEYWNELFGHDHGASFGYEHEALLQKSIQTDLELNNTIVRCKKCGSIFIFIDGWQLFRSMAKESTIMDTSHRSTIICGNCFSIFKCRCDYEHNKMVLIDDVTHEKKELLQEKYL